MNTQSLIIHLCRILGKSCALEQEAKSNGLQVSGHVFSGFFMLILKLKSRSPESFFVFARKQVWISTGNYETNFSSLLLQRNHAKIFFVEGTFFHCSLIFSHSWPSIISYSHCNYINNAKFKDCLTTQYLCKRIIVEINKNYFPIHH